MESPPKPPLLRRLLGRLRPAPGRGRGVLVRLVIVVLLLVVFRYHAISWVVGGADAVSNWTTGQGNLACVEALQRLHEPGLRMLARLNEYQALSKADDPAAVPGLIAIASDSSDENARRAALKALASIRDDRVRAVVENALHDPVQLVRQQAARSAATLGDDFYRGALEDALKSEADDRVSGQIRVALLELLPPDVANDLPQSVPAGSVRVAAIQARSEMGDVEANRARLIKMVREAAGRGAKLIVLPEAAVSGYMNSDLTATWQRAGWQSSEGLAGRPVESAAEAVPGPSTEAFSPLCKELGIYLTVPLVECDPLTRNFFNTVVLLGPDGKILIHYRKLHVWDFPEGPWASAGDSGVPLPVADTPFGRLGVLIGFDSNFEPTHLRDRGVDTLLYCSAWVDRPQSTWFYSVLPRIAKVNRMRIIGANWAVPSAPEWSGYGHSLVIENTGCVVARAKQNIGEEIVYADLPLPVRSQAAAAPVVPPVTQTTGQ